MHQLLDMASSPEYLSPSSLKPEYLDTDINIDPEILSDSSCTNIAPSTVDYSTSDHTSYSEVSHISPFATSPALNDALSTPASSASSPHLHGRKHSLFDHPSPSTTASMYPYPEYMTTSGASPVPQTSAEGPPHHEQLLTYLHHNSPGHETPPPPPPQANPYFGAYGVSVPHQQDPADGYSSYLQQDGSNPLGLMSGSGSYTHRPLAPLNQPSMAPSMLQPSPYRRESYSMALPRLRAAPQGRHAPVQVKRDPARKVRARRGGARRESWSPPPSAQQNQFRFSGDEFINHHPEDEGPDEEVTLDEDTPADLQRLWEVRRKFSAKKGNGMWEDIMVEYLGQDNLAETKKTQVKAALQMKIHRMMLKHGKWPERDRAALLRAYKRWEENRYNEILKLFEEEMGGRRKAFEWKSPHIEAQLVRLGLEEPERDRDSKARKRKQVSARHQSRASTGSTARPLPPPPPPPPRMYHDAYHSYGSGFGGYGHDAAVVLEQQLGVSNPPALTEEQRERLIDECLEREPFQGEEEADVRMADYETRPRTHSTASSLMLPGSNLPMSPPQPQTKPASPVIHAARSMAVARQACGEALKHQHQSYAPSSMSSA